MAHDIHEADPLASGRRGQVASGWRGQVASGWRGQAPATRSRRGRPALAALAGGIAVTLAAAACSSSSSSTSTSGATGTASTASTGTASTGIAGASTATASGAGVPASVRAAVAQLSQVQPAPSLPALPNRPPANITVAFASCVLPTCHAQDSTAAFKALGVKFTMFPWNIAQGPTAYDTALNQALATKPDYLLTNGIFPQATYQAQLDKAKAEHIPVVSVGGVASSAFVACVECQPEYAATGTVAAEIAEVDSGGNPQMVGVLDPTVNPLEQSYEGAVAELAKDGGSIAEVKVSSNNTQQANNQAVVSYLQSHPNVKYVFTATDDYSAGLPQALAQVGLKAKIIAGSALASDYAAIKDGSIFAGIGNSSAMGQWQAADIVARLADGMKIPASLQDPVGWLQIVTKSNADSLNQSVLQAQNYQQSFTTAWKVG